MTDNTTSDVRELRLAVICYGGVSLAVYMHGMTKEMRRLVLASRAFEHDPDNNPFEADDTASAYFDALQSLAHAGTPVRVVIDVISGTSAGGINGVCLATTLACEGDDAKLRDLWLERGDIGGLLNAPGRKLPFWSRIPIVAQRLVLNVGSYTPLRGDDMSQWLFDAIRNMQAARVSQLPSLVPADESLRLRVTATDLQGYTRRIEGGTGGATLTDRTFRHVFEFDHFPAGPSDFTADDTAALALAARCTSSIPGAFPVVQLKEFLDHLEPTRGEDLERIVGRFFGAYVNAGLRPEETVFVDGGVLDNAPFDHAIDLIAHQRAGTEVLRHLIYLEPDPSTPAIAGESAEMGTAPKGIEQHGWLSTAWSAASTVQRHEPLVQQLVRLRELNERIATIGAIADEQMTNVQDLVDTKVAEAGVGSAVTTLSYESLAALGNGLHEEATARGGLAYPMYVRLKLQDSVQCLASAVASQMEYHSESSQATFVRLALGAWLAQRPEFTTIGPASAALLDQVDVGYRDRRLRFVLAGVNELYGTARIPRGSIDSLKNALWNKLQELARASSEAMNDVEVATLAVIANDTLTQGILGTDPAVWAGANADALARLVTAYGERVAPRISTANADLWKRFLDLTDGWDDEVKRPLAVRYVAFPIWDQLIFPIVTLGGTPLFTPIHATRFSPDRATLLGSPEVPGKLRGLAFHHFSAFFHRSWRENDYLWGRLDGSELLLRLLAELDSAGGTDKLVETFAMNAFRAVLASESDLTEIESLRAELSKRVDPPTSSGPAATVEARPSA